MKPEYRIVIPSRKRPDGAGYARSLMGPDAYVYVDEAEVEAYAAHVPADRILTHPKMPGIAAIRRAAILECPTDWLVMCDDDLRHVNSFVGRRVRVIDRPKDVRQIVHNMVVLCEDGGISAFCFSRQPHPGNFKASDPFWFTTPMSCLWGIRGKEILPDLEIVSKEDLDITLQQLLRNRIVLCDRRFYFDFGEIFSGRGGLQGIRTPAGELNDQRLMKRKWGAHIEFTAGGGGLVKTRSKAAMSIKVARRADFASR